MSADTLVENISLRPSLRLSAQQQLALTPQIKHTIRMLQLTASELTHEINEVLENNPLLTETNASPSSISAQDYASWLENLPDDDADTLDDHLIKQLGYLNLPSQDYVITCIVVCELDDDGYLRKTPEELIAICAEQQITTTQDQIKKAIHTLGRLDPPGIGGKDLAECLDLQIRPQSHDEPVAKCARNIIAQIHLLENDAPRLFANLNIDKQTFEAALRLIKQLDPAPGKSFKQEKTVYIQPDIHVIKSDQRFIVSLSPLLNRGIVLNQQYIDLLRASGNPADKEYLKKNLDQAKWWRNALEQRNQTLLAVAKFMTTYQSDYFKSANPGALKPLKQQHIAENIGAHVSTVCRAIRTKYMQTPIGVIPMKQLLSGAIKSRHGPVLSNHAVKSVIKNLIKNEPSQSPLSDSNIVAELETRGITIARRTVNKYREQLNIPASHRRRSL